MTATADDELLRHFDRLLLHWRERGLDVSGASLDQLLRCCAGKLNPGANGMTIRNPEERFVVFAARFRTEAEYRFVAALASYAIGLAKPDQVVDPKL